MRPLRALRYGPNAGNLADLISPPYDVLSQEQVEALMRRDAHNVIRLEHPVAAFPDEPDPYIVAANLLERWRAEATLERDRRPAFYLDEQEFEEAGVVRKRRVLYGRLGLVPWEDGQVLPHEYTMAGPKEDRLRLLSALKANVSPLFLLYDDSGGEVGSLLRQAEASTPVAGATTEGERHSLRAITDPSAIEQLGELFSGRRLYMADGHHRYETALAYHREEGSSASGYVLVGLTAGSDPGLSIHATHRLYSGEVDSGAVRAAIERDFEVADVSEADLRRGLEGEQATFGLAGLDGPSSLLILRPRDLTALARRVPADGPEQWRRLDVNILQHLLLGAALGLDPREPNQAGLSYVHSVEEALRAVAKGDARVAFLLRPIDPQGLFEVSDAGARLPQKTTYFYPKLPAGLVISLLDKS